MTRRTSVTDVSRAMTRQLRGELEAAAGGNRILSRAEEAKAPAHIQDAARQIRQERGPGARVTVDAVEQKIEDAARRLIGAVNQPAGPGATTLSRAEAQAAARQGGRVGELVLRAYEVASAAGVDVDALARARVTAGLDADTVFKTFATVAEAERHADPNGQHVAWLVAVEETASGKVFVSGRNDLWAQRFEVNKLTGAVTVLAEH